VSALISCGLWPGKRGLAAAALDVGGGIRAVRLPRNDDARAGLVAYLVAAGAAELALPDVLVRADALARIALANGLTVWSVPRMVVEPLRQAAGIPPQRAAALAAIAARLPRIAHYRAQLYRVQHADPGKQLRLI